MGNLRLQNMCIAYAFDSEPISIAPNNVSNGGVEVKPEEMLASRMRFFWDEIDDDRSGEAGGAVAARRSGRHPGSKGESGGPARFASHDICSYDTFSQFCCSGP